MSGTITPYPNTSFLAFKLSGASINTNGTAPAYQNPDAMFVGRQLLNTVYCWADVWGGAGIQIYVAPLRLNSPIAPTVWFPVGALITANGMFSFQHRWHQMKAEISGAGAGTANLYCKLFDGGMGSP